MPWAVIACAVLLAAGFAVMAPCSIQMALTMSRVVTARSAQTGTDIRSTAVRFVAGYLAMYVPVAAAFGLIAWALGDWAWIAVGLGAVVSLVLGLGALGTVNLGVVSKCRGPLWLLRTGRASFQKPVRAGVAFGQYCATCCGPYVLALSILAGGTRSFAVGAGVVMVYAVLMALPFLAPAVLRPAVYSQIGAATNRLAPRMERVTGVALVTLAALLVPVTVMGAMA